MQVDSTNTLNFLSLFSTEASRLIFIRAIVFFLIILLLIVNIRFIYRLLQDEKDRRTLIITTALKGLLIPALYLLGVVIVEILAMHFIFIEFHGFYRAFEHYVYELLLILIIFMILIRKKLTNEFISENISELIFRNKYVSRLNAATNQILALNVRDYNLFFVPLGFRYFLTQARIIQSKKENNEAITSKRIIAISNANSKISDNSFVVHALLEHGKLTTRQRNLNLIRLLHESFKIDLFLVPKVEILNKIESEMNGNKIIYENFDNIIIDDKCFFPNADANNLTFEEKEEHLSIITAIFDAFAESTESDYYIGKIIQANAM